MSNLPEISNLGTCKQQWMPKYYPRFSNIKKCFRREQTKDNPFFLLIEWDVVFKRKTYQVILVIFFTLKIIKSSKNHWNWNSLDSNKFFQIKIWYWQQNSTFVNFPWVRMSRSKPISFTVRNTISWCQFFN